MLQYKYLITRTTSLNRRQNYFFFLILHSFIHRGETKYFSFSEKNPLLTVPRDTPSILDFWADIFFLLKSYINKCFYSCSLGSWLQYRYSVTVLGSNYLSVFRKYLWFTLRQSRGLSSVAYCLYKAHSLKLYNLVFDYRCCYLGNGVVRYLVGLFFSKKS